jgi:flagellar motor switch/type III secretory pathway protein FliN
MRGLRLRPFSLEGLPRLPPAVVPWTRAVCRARAGLAERVAVTLSGIGALVVRPSRLDFVWQFDREGEVFVLEVRGHRGRLVIDTPLAARLVRALLGAPPPVALRPLGRAERGMLAAVVVAVLDAAGMAGAVRVGLEPAPPLAGDALALDLQVRAEAGEGLARLELPVAALPAVPPTARILPSLVAPRVTIELGRTTLDGGALAAAGPGDAVVFDGLAPASAADPWPVDLRFGACVLPAHLHTDGSLRKQGPLATNESEVPMSSPPDTETETRPALSEEAARALAGAPVELVAELGRINIRGDELVGLIEGGVLSLGPRRPTQVQLRVGPRLWALGELVAVDDELAVRITEIVR